MGMSLNIQTQNALIGIDRTPSQLYIRQNQWPMEMSSKKPRLELNIEEAVIFIDQSQCFSEAGLKSTIELGREFAAKGIQSAMETTARIARDGREMADVHKGIALARLAKRNSTPKIRQVAMDLIPKSRPIITVQPAKIEGYFDRGYIDIKLGKIEPDIYYTAGKVEVYLKQKDTIKYHYVGNVIDVFGG